MKGKSVPKHRENTLLKGPKLASTVRHLNRDERDQWKDWERERVADLEGVRAVSRQNKGLLEKARELSRQRLEEDRVPVELQVTDVRHARSAEVLGFCLSHLGAGGTWGALRHKLGLSPGDIRWKLIRERAIEGLLPVNEEEALKAVGSQRSFLVDKLEGMLEDLESRINMMESGKMAFDHHFWKLKIETMKLLFEENSKQLSDHLEIKKVKAAEKANTGVSIVVQNSFYIPRPGDSKEKIVDVVPIINELAEMVKELDVNPEKL